MKPAFKVACLLAVAVALAATVVLWRMHQRNTEGVGAPTSLSGRAAVPSARSKQVIRQPGLHKENVRAPTSLSGRPAVPKTVEEKEQPSPVSVERVRLVLNRDNTAGYPQRVAAIHAIETTLTDAEVDALYRYLLSPSRDELNQERENWLRNEIMDKLVEQPVLPRGLPDVLIAVYQDTAQDAVTRDYAVQHMAPAYERATAQGQAKLQTALWQATTETDISIAGTALLALLDVVGGSGSVLTDSGLRRAEVVATATQAGADATERVPPVDKVRLAQTALNLAADDHCGELARITAVQVCGRMAVEQALPVVEQLTQEAQSMPLRIAATAALGDYGTPEASNLLVRVAASADPRQALAAQSALRRFAGGQVALARQTGPRATR